jgi:hypothetical protein
MQALSFKRKRLGTALGLVVIGENSPFFRVHPDLARAA